jgi:arylsulfatase A-like enzyme
MFLAAGPNIRPGYVRGRLEDVTPTVLALLEIPVPAGLDGRPLDLLKDVEAKEANVAQAGERAPAGLRESPAEVSAARAGRDPATGYTAEEEEEVRRRLEELGYL